MRVWIDVSETVANPYGCHAFGWALGDWSESVENRYTYKGRE